MHPVKILIRLREGAHVQRFVFWRSGSVSFYYIVRIPAHRIFQMLSLTRNGLNVVFWLMFSFSYIAFGTDAHSCDPGQNNNRNRCHEEFLPNGVVLLEFVANLDMMPPTGSQIFAGAFKIKDGSGGPVRIFAIYGEDMTSDSVLHKVEVMLLVLMMFCIGTLT